MKIAIFSDVHGNSTALDAVLADATAAGAEEFWVVGDLAAHGPHPARTLERLRSVPHARFVRGNTDRYVVTGELPEIVRSGNAELLLSAAVSFAWTRGAVTAAGAYDWLAALPVESRVRLPDGTRVLLVHAAPGTDDGPGIQASMTDAECGLDGAAADLVFVGHTHRPLDRTVSGIRVVNLGSVSLPMTDERRAMWTLLSADEGGYRIERKFTAYDIDVVCAEIEAAHHPSADWLTVKLRRRRS